VCGGEGLVVYWAWLWLVGVGVGVTSAPRAEFLNARLDMLQSNFTGILQLRIAKLT
jgi:hypothetical protein